MVRACSSHIRVPSKKAQEIQQCSDDSLPPDRWLGDWLPTQLQVRLSGMED